MTDLASTSPRRALYARASRIDGRERVLLGSPAPRPASASDARLFPVVSAGSGRASHLTGEARA